MRTLKAALKMKNRILLLMILVGFSNLLKAQSVNRTYLMKGTPDNLAYCYQVVELTIHDDATFTSITFGCGDKKNWKNYKNWKSKIQNGRTTWNGKYYELTEYRDGFKTDFSWTVKITDKNVIYYELNKNDKLKKTAKYKRTKFSN